MEREQTQKKQRKCVRKKYVTIYYKLWHNKQMLSHKPTYSQLVAMVRWGAHSNSRRSRPVRVTEETVGIRLPVCLSTCLSLN